MKIVLSILPLAVLFCAQGCIGTSRHHADAVAGFDPAEERVLPLGAPCAMHLFQFRSGEVFVDGHGPGTTQEQALQDQRRIDHAGGIDLSACGGKTGFQLVGEGCLFAGEPHGRGWDKTTAKQVIAKMKHVNFVRPPRAGTPSDPFAASTGGGFGVTQLEAQEIPITYLFKTVRSEVGIMEILDIVEDDRGYAGDGMKFRYKMVRQ